MSVLKKLETEVCYFYFYISDIPFEKAGIEFNYKYAYARMLNGMFWANIDFGRRICGIYDFFTNEPIKNIEKIKSNPFFTNQQSTWRPLLRGDKNEKWTFIGSEPQTTLDVPNCLPHITNSSFLNSKSASEDISYFDKGVSVHGLGYGCKETEFKNVMHLASNTIYSTDFWKFFIYLEFLKIHFATLTDNEIIEKLQIFDESFESKKARLNDREAISWFRKPIYREIPIKYRERAINEVDDGKEFFELWKKWKNVPPLENPSLVHLPR